MKKTTFLFAVASAALTHMALANTIYVSLEYGNDETGTGTRTNPMKTIQAGVDKLRDWGSALWISNGVYKLDQEIFFGNTDGQNYCIVRSMSGNPADVVIDGQNKVRCIRCTGYNTQFRNITVQNGRVSGRGAGLYLNGQSYTVSNCVVRNCHATPTDSNDYGGGVYITRGSSVMDTKILDCSIDKGSVSRAYGGGLAIGYYYNETGESTSAIRNCLVSNCVARGSSDVRGGGVYINRANVYGLRVMDCKSLNTQATPTSAIGEGGGVYKLTYITNTFENVLITNCLANYHGGAFSGNGGSGGLLLIRNCSFVGNRIEPVPSDKYVVGGGCCLLTASYDIANCRFAANHVVTTARSNGNGAGLYLSGSTASSVRDCVITDNVTDEGDVGGIYANARVTVSNCVIAANSAYRDGGFRLSAHNSLLTDTFCLSNMARDESIGRVDLSGAGAGVRIRNSFFAGNGGETTKYLGMLWLRSASANAPVTLEQCTFVSNGVNSVAGYVVCPSSDNPATAKGTPSVTNSYVKGCVFASNYKTVFPNEMNVVTNITYTYSDAFRATWWTSVSALHNYDKAMMPDAAVPLVDPAHGDYRLKAGTPFINGGVNEAWMGTGLKRGGPKDMGDGTYTIGTSGTYGVTVSRNNAQPRVRGCAVDYGCFEYPTKPGFVFAVPW